MKRSAIYSSLIIGIVSLTVFLLFQAKGIYGGDSGDLSTAAALFGIPHPSGYPLYTFLSWLATLLPVATVAWRVALLSSVPHAVTIAILFLLTYRLTKSFLAALFSALLLAGNYVFFLYSVIPEVYALADFFLVSILYMFIVWENHPKDLRYGAVIAFLFGLALSHHHAVIFVGAAIGFWWLIMRKWATAPYLRLPILVVYALFGFLGLLPHVYIYFAAGSGSIINWLGLWSWGNFFRLFSLSAYGTFTSSAFYGQLPYERWLGMKAFTQFLVSDFTAVGCILAVVGGVFLYRKTRSLFLLLAICFVTVGPFWYFYGSFPLMNRFTVGTYEQFLSSPYLLFSLFIGAGVAQILVFVRAALRKRRASIQFSRIVILLFMLVLFIYPAVLGAITVWRFWGFSDDRTGDYFGQDMLRGLPVHSILLLGQDTPLFITQYERYGNNYRTDIAVLHAGRVGNPDYNRMIIRAFPQLTLSDSELGENIHGFIKANRDAYPLFANKRIPLDTGWFWVPYGLVFRLVNDQNLPRLEDLTHSNDAIWQTFHDPTIGILSRYNHLFLSEIRDVYANARIEYGKILMRGNDMTGALSQFQKALLYGGDAFLSEAYTYTGLSHLFLGDCTLATTAFENAKKMSLAPDKQIILYEASVARDCQKDATRAAELLRSYEISRQAEDTQLGIEQ